MNGLPVVDQNVAGRLVHRCWVVLLGGLLAACGNTSADLSSPQADQPAVRIAPTATAGVVPSSNPTSAPGATPAAPMHVAVPTRRADPAPNTSPFQQQVAPPGVAAQLQLGAGALGFTCQALPDASLGLRITISAAEYEVAQGFSICFSGIMAGQPIDVTVQRPDGVVQRIQVPANPPFGFDALDWPTWPGDPLGTYQVRATQGDQQATGTFVLRAASQPQMVVFPGSGAPGTTFRIGLAGYSPQQTVHMHLYKGGEDFTATYLSSLPVVVDDNGQAIYTFATHPDDPPGTYFIFPDSVDRDRVFGLNVLTLNDPSTQVPSLSTGQSAATRPPDARDLWTTASGGERVFARPKLYGGSVVTIMALADGAVQVRTEEGVVGWIHEPASSALTNDLTVAGEQNRFIIGTRVQIVYSNGIPLRAEPRPDAAKLRERLAPGQQATIQEVRGDWLQITLDDGTLGWARWYYDGVTYVDVLPS